MLKDPMYRDMAIRDIEFECRWPKKLVRKNGEWVIPKPPSDFGMYIINEGGVGLVKPKEPFFRIVARGEISEGAKKKFANLKSDELQDVNDYFLFVNDDEWTRKLFGTNKTIFTFNN